MNKVFASNLELLINKVFAKQVNIALGSVRFDIFKEVLDLKVGRSHFDKSSELAFTSS